VHGVFEGHGGRNEQVVSALDRALGDQRLVGNHTLEWCGVVVVVVGSTVVEVSAPGPAQAPTSIDAATSPIFFTRPYQQVVTFHTVSLDLR
jgi:hypothetical protein